MSSDPLKPEDRQALLRWRMALGPGAERAMPELGLDRLGAEGDAGGLGLGEGELRELDQVLSFVYGDREDTRSGGGAGSRPYLPRWLAAVRRFFRHDVVALVQKDAIEKKGLTQLLLEPETLPLLERNAELVATLVAAKHLVPDQAKEAAREIVREVVDGIRRQLESEVRTAVLGAIRRDQHSPIRSLRNVDWGRTIRKNLEGWDPEARRLVPRRFYFWKNQRRRHEWDVVLLVDQSGSMAESVVYASVMAAIFASLDVLRPRLVVFDTEVVDLTPLLSDPVDVLFAAQLGGGTDINRAVAYAQANLIERPERTLLILVSDLYEGGNAGELVARLRQLVDSRVRALTLLALTDAGRPSYDHALAQALVELGVPCFGCTPRRLVEVIARVLRGQDPVSHEPGAGR